MQSFLLVSFVAINIFLRVRNPTKSRPCVEALLFEIIIDYWILKNTQIIQYLFLVTILLVANEAFSGLKEGKNNITGFRLNRQIINESFFRPATNE
jgi:hypothetical protein